MSDIDHLVARIKEEFASHRQKVLQVQAEQVQEHKARQQRSEQVEAIFDKLRSIWKPRLEALAVQFKDSVKVTPTVTPGQRQATLKFQSPLARIDLRFSAAANRDVTKVVLAYDLDVLPIYVEFEKHAQIEFPLDRVDEVAVAQWFDDRIIAFVKVFVSLYQNEYYLKDHMVEDPVAHVRFPKFSAGASLQREGKTYYFLSEETRREYESQSA